MKILHKILQAVHSLVQKHQLDEDMDVELRSHIEFRTEANIKEGMTPEEARFAAMRQFGGKESIRESCRDQRGVRWVGEFMEDLRLGLRILGKNRAFGMAIITTLALGIGATASLFCWLNALLFRSLPYPEANRIVMVFEEWKEKGWGRSSVSPGTFQDWKEQNQCFSAVGAFAQTPMTVRFKDSIQTLKGLRMSPVLCDVLKTSPLCGRGFLPEESQPGRDGVALISHQFWMRQFAGAPGAVGSAMEINGRSHVIVGVMPEGFRFPYATEVWTPLTIDGKEMERRDQREWLVMGRLRDSVTMEQAATEMSTISQRIAERFPKTNHGWDCEVMPLRALYVSKDDVRTSSALFLGGLFVLLTALANVANLLMARFSSRRKEIAVRLSLGASRGRILRQLLTECLLLSALGTMAGVCLALGLSSVIRTSIPAVLVGQTSLMFDGLVLAFTFGLCLLTTVVSGIVPAWRLAGSDPGAVIKQTAGTVVAGGGSRSLSNVWIICEVGCAIALLVGASLMIHTIANLSRTDLGFESRNLLVADVDLTGESRAGMDVQSRVNYFDRLRDEIGTINGVKQVAIFQDAGHLDILPEGSSEERNVHLYDCSSNFLSCMQVPLIKGRFLSDGGYDGSNEVIINETFAQQCWPGQDPIGKRFKVANVAKAVYLQVAGVVGDFKLDRSELKRPILFESYRVNKLQIVSLFVRVQQQDAAVMGAARLKISGFDPALGVPQVRTMSEVLYEAIESKHFVLWLLGAFSIISLILAVTGIYGMLSHLVAQREKEMGIRIAIGAQPQDVIIMIVRQGMTYVVAGIGCGIMGSLVLRNLLENQMVGIGGVDWASISISILLMITVSFIACFLPAFKASRTDPMRALRQE